MLLNIGPRFAPAGRRCDDDDDDGFGPTSSPSPNRLPGNLASFRDAVVMDVFLGSEALVVVAALPTTAFRFRLLAPCCFCSFSSLF